MQQTFAYFFRNLTKTTCEARGMGGRGKRKGENGKRKAKLRQYEQRTSNGVRTQFVPFGARTANAGKGLKVKG